MCDSASCAQFTWSYISRLRDARLNFSSFYVIFGDLIQNNSIQFKIHLIDISTSRTQ